MDYLQDLKYHFQTRNGWINDPNGLVYYKGYYHVFYQHARDSNLPNFDGMCWGHARTKDFLSWEELPVALTTGDTYDRDGCWSGTAIVRGDVLYLVYTSRYKEDKNKHSAQTISIAYSTDGVHFKKYEGNPVIATYPADGGPDFRDPAVTCIDGKLYCVVASGNPESRTARLLLYRSDDLFCWSYVGVMSEWAECKYAECPSFMRMGERYLLATSVCPIGARHYFQLMIGDFKNDAFVPRYVGEIDKGPDQYAGQLFTDHLGRVLMISWLPGWKYEGFAARDVGCLSVPREVRLQNGRIAAYPPAELQHLLKDEDPAVRRTEGGFVIEREGRDPVVFEGEVRDLKILRDGYIVEVFVNGGEEIYTALL